MAARPTRRIRLALDKSELFRRYFINTLFDATFVVLGVVSATAVLPETPASSDITLVTMVSACLAIGVSTGVSVYEAERLEGEIRLAKIERAMLSDLADTDVHRRIRHHRMLVSLVNFSAPLIVLAITSVPFVLHVTAGWPTLNQAAQLSILVCIVVVFVTGYAVGRAAGVSAIRQGLRMTIAALGTFILLVLLETFLI